MYNYFSTEAENPSKRTKPLDIYIVVEEVPHERGTC
jgi:hypothetical protein